MDNDRQLGGASDFHLTDKDILLHLARRMIVKVIKPDFPEANYARMVGQRVQFHIVILCCQLSFMWVDADACINPIVLLGDADGAIECARSSAAADGKDIHHTCGPG